MTKQSVPAGQRLRACYHAGIEIERIAPGDIMSTSPAPRNFGKKLALVCAASSLTCGFLALGATLWFWQTGGKPIITGSLGATTFFFVTASIVLYEMSRPRLYPPAGEEDAAGPADKA